MATLIPETIKANATGGEKALARLLSRLPEDWTIYFEPTVGRWKPDFVILAPNLGLLVIEVKDWQMGTVRNVNQQSVELHPKDEAQPVTEKNPLLQVNGYWQAVVAECRRSEFGQGLLQTEEPWKGKLCFPVGAVVLFTQIAEKNVRNSPHAAAWNQIFTPENTILADQRRTWEEMDEAALVAALKPYFQPFTMKTPFTAHQIDILRWVLFPESRLDVILRRSGAQAARVMEVLDARQEQHAKSLGSGHRILSGVAGSGKTVLLLARARLMAMKHPEQKSLFLCYNKVLAAWLEARMEDCRNVKVMHFDGWAKSMRLTRHEQDNAVFGARVLDALTQRGSSARIWDTVLIDEAQDFEPTWFQCALAAMKDPVNGDLVIVADGSQRLYKRNKVSWKALGIHASGRSVTARFDLDKNYRNTPNIAKLARDFSKEEKNADGINAIAVREDNCRRVEPGSSPTLVRADSHAAQVEAALEIAGNWLQGKRRGKPVEPMKPEEIGIFYSRLEGRDESLMQRLLQGLDNLAETRWLTDKQDSNAHLKVNDPAIKVQTIMSSKGLQYKAVIVLWADQLPGRLAEEDEDRRQLYVAMTRAENDLVLLGCPQQGFTAELGSKCSVLNWPDFSKG